jgi:hypothetical protein
MAGDWIKLHRKLLEGPIFQHDGMFRLWCYCLMRANWKDATWMVPGTLKSINVPRGSFITGREALHRSLYGGRRRGANTPASTTVWSWLLALERLQCITLANLDNRCTLVSVCKYSTYQDTSNDELTTGCQPSDNRLTTGCQPADTIEESKNIRTNTVAEPATEPDGSEDGKQATSKATGKGNGYPSEFEEFWLAYPARDGRRRGKGEAFALWRQVRADERPSVLEAAKQYAASSEALRGFARDPVRFFKKNWWREWIPTLAIHAPAPPVVKPPEIPRTVAPASWENV